MRLNDETFIEDILDSIGLESIKTDDNFKSNLIFS